MTKMSFLNENQLKHVYVNDFWICSHMYILQIVCKISCEIKLFCMSYEFYEINSHNMRKMGKYK